MNNIKMLFGAMIANWVIALAGIGLFLFGSHKFMLISMILAMAGIGGASLSMMSLEKIKKRYHRYCHKLVLDNPESILIKFNDQDKEIIITGESLFIGKSMFTFDSGHEKLTRIVIDQKLYPPEAVFTFVRTALHFLPARNVSVSIPAELVAQVEEIAAQLKKKHGIS